MNNSTFPKISIIIPSYKQGMFLEETIVSILDQNYSNLEMILMDGGSNDNTIQIIDKYKKYFTYWISKKDNGQSDAINQGFKKATGEIVTWLCSDDTYLSGTLEYVGKYFNEYPEIDVLFGDVKSIDSESNVITELRGLKFSKRKYLSRIGTIPQPASFFKKSLLEKIGLLDESLNYCMDYDFFARIIFTDHNLLHVNISLATYRYHNLSKSVSGLNLEGGHNSTMIILQKKYSNENNYNLSVVKLSRIWFNFLRILKNIDRFLKYRKNYLVNK